LPRDHREDDGHAAPTASWHKRPLREARLALGVPGDARPADLVGEHGDRWLFRFGLPTEHGMRTSAVRVSATSDGVLVEHLVVDEVQRGYSEPAADAPETTRVILDMPGVQPAMLRSIVPVALGEHEVPALIAGLFCEMIAEDEDLRGRLREVEAPQRPERNYHSYAALPARTRPHHFRGGPRAFLPRN